MLPLRLRNRLPAAVLLTAAIAGLAAALAPEVGPPAPFDETERALIVSLGLDALPPLPAEPGNAVADDPLAARLGHRLFFDTRLSANGAVSCATCHRPERRFTDGLPRGTAIGRSKRNTPSLIGVAYSPWYYWDGRRDSQWSQALSPLEDPNEHGFDRRRVIELLKSDPVYAGPFESLFGPLPAAGDIPGTNRAFASVGKALAAYQRKLLPGPSRFDRYASHVAAGGDSRAQDLLSDKELRGLELFIGRGRCIECHNGPLFSNNEFHNTGVLSSPGSLPDRGRYDGISLARSDPFNCNGEFSDDPEKRCAELEFAREGPELVGAFRTPSLRNLADTEPYHHQGQTPTLAAVLDHYNRAPDAMIGHNEAKPLRLSRRELRQLLAFLETLAAPPATDPAWLAPPD